MSNKPNVLIFMPDEVQAEIVRDDHPCLTPRLDAFKKEGINFSQAYTPSPHCCPSRATFMTGLYPSRHGVFNNVCTSTAHQKFVNPDVRCFSEDLEAVGYNLYFSGKYHISSEETPKDRGWKEVSLYEQPYVADQGVLEKQFKEDVVNYYGEHRDQVPAQRCAGEMLRPGWPSWTTYGQVREHIEDMFWYQKAVKPGIDCLKQLKNEAEPWCLYVSTDMEGNSECLREFLEMYKVDDVELPPSFDDKMHDKPNIYQRMRYQNLAQLSEEEIKQSMIHYWANCSLEDHYFGLLLDALEATGQADNTIVIFVADHGDYNFAHGMNFMGIPPFREAYHVPALVRWPNGIANPGREVDALVSLADFAPTLNDICDAPSSQIMSGQSLAPFLNESTADWRDALLCQCNGNENYFTQRIIFDDHYKYVYNAFDFDELYDLHADPYEMTNLAHPNRMQQDDPHQGVVADRDSYTPWPKLHPNLEPVRKEYMAKMWRQMQIEEDMFFNGFMPCAMANYGPFVGIK